MVILSYKYWRGGGNALQMVEICLVTIIFILLGACAESRLSFRLTDFAREASAADGI